MKLEASFVDQDDVIDYIERCFYDLNENHAQDKGMEKVLWWTGMFRRLTCVGIVNDKYGR